MGSKYQWWSSRVPVQKLWFFLLALPLLYAALFKSHSLGLWKNQITNWTSSTGASQSQNITESIKNIVIEEEVDPRKFLVRRLVQGKDLTELDDTGFSCDSTIHSDVCVSYEPVSINTRSMTVYLSPNQKLPPMNRTVQPYANKDNTARKLVSKVEILRDDINNKPPPSCDITHNVSAVVFATSFKGNLYHEFNEIIIPLFLTTRLFQSHLQFIIIDCQPWWISKYNRVLTHLSHYNVMNPAEDNGKVHCFPGAVIGLKYHDNLALNTSEIPGGYSLNDFRTFLRDSFSLKTKNVDKIKKPPVLVLISRSQTRVLLNEYEVIGLARELGFQVITATPDEMSNLDRFASIVNSCSVLLGVHGAGMTNTMFMPERSVLLQVVPLGLDWASTFYYGDTAIKMNLHYLGYRIKPEESSLLEKYGPDHPVITDPDSIHRQGYRAARAAYLDGQNVKLDLSRFRKTLLQALKLIGSSKSLEKKNETVL